MKELKKHAGYLFIVAVLLFTFQPLSAQNPNTIQGKVIDTTHEPLIGVSIMLKGTNTGTITDVNGEYSLNVPDKNTATLVFSYIGFDSQEIDTQGKNSINVTLRESSHTLNEVVVVGYGIQKRKDITGAVVSIKPDDLENMPSSNIVQALQGKMPGLNITNTASSAEGDTKIRVRVQNSISADAGPLIILDGIQYNGFLSEINPNDIESIEVLKDASSAAIYGAEAANGVILITTKRGVAGKPRVSFDTNFGFSNIINTPNMMDGTQFYNFKKERKGVSTIETELYEKGTNAKWLDEAMQTGFEQNYNLSISGGSENTRYYVAGNLSDTKGVAINDVYKRYTLRFNFEIDITSWLKYGTNTSLGYYNRPGKKADISAALKMTPLSEIYDENGNLNYKPNPNDSKTTSPLEGLNVQREDVARGAITNNYIQVNFPFVKGLSYKLLTGYNFRSRLIEEYKAASNTLEGEINGGVAEVNNQYKQDWSIENIVNYNRQISKHFVDLTAVYSSREFVTKYHDLKGSSYPGDFNTYYQFKDGDPLSMVPKDTYTREASLSQMFRLNYNYDSRYLFTATVRRDGFSAFGANNKYGIFPSVALGWNMEQEAFMQSLQWLDRSKLRLSYGENGNQAIKPYTTIPSMERQYYLDNDKNSLPGFYSKTLGDPTLSWETTRQVNIGLDFSFLKGRILGSFDAFFANTYDLLLDKAIPEINGVTKITQNIGKTKSHGIELAISTVNVQTKNFSWRTDFNIAHSRNEIINVGLFDENGKALDNVANSWFIGKPINVIYGYKFGGIWQETDDIQNSHMPTAKPGDVIVVDTNKDGKISSATGEDDRQIIGYKDPNLTAGMMNTFNYKNISFSFFFNAVNGVTRFTEYTNTYSDGTSNMRQREWWTPENKLNTYPANRDDSNPYGITYYGKTNNASYIRLSDISLAYRFPKTILSKIGLQRLEVFGNIKNLCTFTNYIGLDPEFEKDYTTPQTRTFLFGLRLEL